MAIFFFVNNYSDHRAQSPIQSDRWTHVVGTFDGTQIQLYIDGELAATTPYTASISHSTEQSADRPGAGQYELHLEGKTGRGGDL